VADELVKEFNQGIDGRVDSKNIRRRVYDALNVLMAMKIIEKEKKEIRWRGLPTTDAKGELEALQLDKAQRLERIQKKKEYLQELDTQKLLYKNLIERNSRKLVPQTDERVFLPFIIIHTRKQTTIECEMSEDRSEYFFDFSLPFSIHDDNEILKRMGLNDVQFVEKLERAQQQQQMQQVQQTIPGKENIFPLPLPYVPPPLVPFQQQQPQPNLRSSYPPQTLVSPQNQLHSHNQNTQAPNQQTQQYHTAQPLL